MVYKEGCHNEATLCCVISVPIWNTYSTAGDLSDTAQNGLKVIRYNRG